MTFDLKRLGFVVLVFLMACSSEGDDATSQEPVEVADEYRVPYAVRQIKQKMYYAIEPFNDTLVVEFERYVKDTVHYEHEVSVIKSTGVAMSRYTIVVTEHGTQLLEAESFLGGKMVREKILSQRSLPRGPRKYKGVEIRREYNVSAFEKVISTSVETFDRDTVFRWNGENVPSLKFKIYAEETTVNKFFPWAKSKRSSRRFGLYTKGIGFTYMRSKDDAGLEMSFKLVRIDVIEPARE
jgi:hypothetical protein